MKINPLMKEKGCLMSFQPVGKWRCRMRSSSGETISVPFSTNLGWGG